MNPYPSEYWNTFYEQEAFVYGVEPNAFFKQILDDIEAGSILLPAEGEGRNAVYAASTGWKTTAFDISEAGKKKALQLARKQGVSIGYQVTGALDFTNTTQFDVLGLSYAHIPIAIKKQAYQQLLTYLKDGGMVIFEAFAKAQLGKASGGPSNLEMLFSIEEIQEEFAGLDFKILKQETIELNEGLKHVGEAEVIRFVGIKK